MPTDPRQVPGKKPYPPLLREDIRIAQSQTRSHAAAARYLNASLSRYERWAKEYELYHTVHKNRGGKGTHKCRKIGTAMLDDIIAGKHPSYNRKILKQRLIRSAYIPGECDLCGHKETRPDGHGPILLHYRNGNRFDLSLSNLYLLCYNCTYLTTGVIAVSRKLVERDISPKSYRQDDLAVLDESEMELLQEELHADTAVTTTISGSH